MSTKRCDKFIVAVKIREGKKVIQGKILGQYRKAVFAERDLVTLAARERLTQRDLGIFQHGKLVS